MSLIHVPVNPSTSMVCLQCIVPYGFCRGMKLEALENANDIGYVATVVDINESLILIHYDGWSKTYDFWTHPYSGLIHAIGWCRDNGVELAPPNSRSLKYWLPLDLLRLALLNFQQFLKFCIQISPVFIKILGL